MDTLIIDRILAAGQQAAYLKMTLEENLQKDDLRTLNFTELQNMLIEKVLELGSDNFKTFLPGNLSEELIDSIWQHAGDVICIASSIAAKCDQELNRIRNQSEPSLFDS